jgi:hypothetical protein
MLERPALLLLLPDASGGRVIVDAASGALLGSARWPKPPPLPWWRRPLRAVLEVREDDDDEPLLCTVRRCWSLWPRREVRDADDRRVGTFLGPLLDDALGRRLAVRTWDDNRLSSVIRTRYGEVLAWTVEETKGVRLEFGPLVAGEPFVKMLLLAATLFGEERGRY